MSLYWIETYGCQMNQAETNALEGLLSQAGWSKADSESDADLVVLNTCAVRQTAEDRIWGRIGHYKHLKSQRPLKLAVMGCMAQRLKDEIQKRERAVDLVIGTFDKQKFVRELRGLLDGPSRVLASEAAEFEFGEYHGSEKAFQAFVPIMHGCNNFCTYCIVPYVRGREVSRDPESILGEIRRLEGEGVKDITLLGQNVNSYCYGTGDLTVSFAELLKRIDEETDVPWVRFMSSHPKDLSDEVIEIIGRSEKICSHIHLAVQHGSDPILKRMNRKYTSGDFLALVKKMRSRIPDLSLTTDILIGFPGETEEDFEKTLELVKTMRFDDAFTYYYNPRTGTKAADWDDQVPLETKKERLARLIDLQRQISKECKDARVGETCRVLIESVSKKDPKELLGRTARDQRVVFQGEDKFVGQFADIKIVRLAGNTYKGELISCRGN